MPTIAMAALFVAITAISSAAAAQTLNAQTIDRIEGRYEGEVMNGGAFRPVTTQFKASPANLWGGHYVIVELRGKQTSGELTDCAPQASLELLCQWHDPYGTGRVVFSFARDLRSFRGRWSSPAEPQSWFPWNGTKQD